MSTIVGGRTLISLSAESRTSQIIWNEKKVVAPKNPRITTLPMFMGNSLYYLPYRDIPSRVFYNGESSLPCIIYSRESRLSMWFIVESHVNKAVFVVWTETNAQGEITSFLRIILKTLLFRDFSSPSPYQFRRTFRQRSIYHRKAAVNSFSAMVLDDPIPARLDALLGQQNAS
jgi:hypothetical protein